MMKKFQQEKITSQIKSFVANGVDPIYRIINIKKYNKNEDFLMSISYCNIKYHLMFNIKNLIFEKDIKHFEDDEYIIKVLGEIKIVYNKINNYYIVYNSDTKEQKYYEVIKDKLISLQFIQNNDNIIEQCEFILENNKYKYSISEMNIKFINKLEKKEYIFKNRNTLKESVSIIGFDLELILNRVDNALELMK